MPEDYNSQYITTKATNTGKILEAKYLNLKLAVEAMREEALANDTWYTFLPCEYAEAVDIWLDPIKEQHHAR